MFLSLVRPERISSPITRSAAETTSLGAGEAVAVMVTRGLAANATDHPYPAIVGYDASSHSPGASRSRPSKVSRPLDHAEYTRGGWPHVRTGAAAPDCLCAPTHRVRAAPQRCFALPLERTLGALRSELGAPLPCGGRAQSSGRVPGRARRRRLAQVDLCGGAPARRRAGAEPDRARALGRAAGDDPLRQ